MNWEKASKEVSTQNWATLLVLGLASFFLASSTFTLGIILGGLLIIANFHVLQHTICSAFPSDGVMKRKKKSIIVKYYLRLAILGIVIYTLVTKAWVDPVGLTIGLSTVVISIFSFGVRSVFKKSPEETI